MSREYKVISFVRDGKAQFIMVDAATVAAEIDTLHMGGATYIKLWTRECWCEAGWLVDGEGSVVDICQSCPTGNQLYALAYPEDVIPF
mgnify:CR=1 FL=1